MESLECVIRRTISQADEPLILPGYLKWDMINWDLSKWTEVLGNQELECRFGHNAKTDIPQWEKNTPTIKGDIKDLLTFTKRDRWLYFDYKYLKHWLLEAKEFREQIKFSDLGLTDVAADESTIWIGTKGAHTPCHVDSYGYNVVAQIYGQKLWLLFNPDEDLKATRIPYEESTIYSKLNFFSPTKISDFEGIHNGKLIVMNPGDVLIVPNKWWHYVESLDTSISINTWLPLEQDHSERQRECLLQILIGSLLNNADDTTQMSILNPDSYDVLKQPLTEKLKIFKMISKVSSSEQAQQQIESKPSDFHGNYPICRRIENLTDGDFKQFLEKQSERFSNEAFIIQSEPEENQIFKKITHAVTHPDVIDLILKKINTY